MEQSTYNFEKSNPEFLKSIYELHEKEAARLLEIELIMPAYEQILHCSHVFNLLDARGVLGRDERMATILRIRKLSERLAKDLQC